MEGAGKASGGQVRQWTVRLTVVENDADTTADAVLETDTGAQVSAEGRSQRSENDESAPEIGDEVADDDEHQDASARARAIRAPRSTLPR